MYNVITSFGNYPTRLRNGKPGKYTQEELGLIWLKHVAATSSPGMLQKYRLVLLLPRSVIIPEQYNLDLEQWGEKRRFDENNKFQPWPVGQNMDFKQILWLYANKKLEGPFLWCEPDCVPVKPTWLDDLFGEYERAGKPFMGDLVEAFTAEDGGRVPKHMSGNAIYPDKAYLHAPGLMECHGTAWDVYAANQILQPQNFHQTEQIQHEVADYEKPTINGGSVALYHPDKFGYFANRKEPVGRPLVEMFGEADPPIQDPSIDELLDAIDRACHDDKDTRRKVAYFMLDHGIVNQGYLGHHMKKKAQERLKAAAHAESSQ